MRTTMSRRAAGVALVSAALMTGGAATSHAAQSTGTAGSETRSTARVAAEAKSGQQIQAARWAQCTAQVNNPHWSRGAGSVIFKTRVSCQGNIPRVHVKVRGKLHKKSGNRWVSVAASNETKVKVTNGSVSTYYTPKPSGTNVTRDGTYKGTITVQITSPVRGTVGTASSRSVRVNTPGS
ncbi:hypothetical protein [Streptomyces iconiensis]|uniref:Uncharacterized protein n=1 Tax=Streptomyces iconiensis TaxID=1384038 RepID=A0ABT7AAF3_9ACTN|nr:hypothetical protein [Streptomyces iconiensis]MDJ1138320.1 hypothetical protein [Streptomyces iconiensis]